MSEEKKMSKGKKDGRGAHTGKSHKPHLKSPVIGDGGLKLKPGDNTKYAGAMLEISSWGEVDSADVEALEERFWKLVEYCAINDIRVTNMLAYYALGITKDTAGDWKHGRSRTPEHSRFIRRVQQFCSTYREMLGADGKIHPTTLIWWQKNYDGLVDKQELVVTPNDPLGEIKDPAEIKKRLEEGIPEDIIDVD